MADGYWGRILRVDLSTGKISVDAHEDAFYRTYMGGKGIVHPCSLSIVPLAGGG